ncbi:hypothetical protein PR048_005296 [Dryococelus australis]|uniref:Uncharacterized protein n=1 Tax=Dryococelus australis TaxID=614101 RepID=A0ABQ9I7V6_9NEOP|nr:hypothetical protein PR048_005296 [Dryococelus australis]
MADMSRSPQAGIHHNEDLPDDLATPIPATELGTIAPPQVASPTSYMVRSTCSLSRPPSECYFMMASEKLKVTVNGLYIQSSWFGAAPEYQGKREIPEKTRRPVVSSSTIRTCEYPVATPPGIGPGSPREEVEGDQGNRVIAYQFTRSRSVTTICWKETCDKDIQNFIFDQKFGEIQDFRVCPRVPSQQPIVPEPSFFSYTVWVFSECAHTGEMKFEYECLLLSTMIAVSRSTSLPTFTSRSSARQHKASNCPFANSYKTYTCVNYCVAYADRSA